MHDTVIRAPITSPTQLIDVCYGTGIGIQTYLLGNSFPSSRVYGIDLTPVPTCYW